MKKSDLKTGMRVETRGGSKYIVLKDVETMWHGHQGIFFANNEGFEEGSNYDEALLHESNPKYDVMKVFNVVNEHSFCGNAKILDLNFCSKPIWERKEAEEMTLEEICRELGREIKIVKER